MNTTTTKSTLASRDIFPTILDATNAQKPTFNIMRELGINAMTMDFREEAYGFNLEKEIDDDIRFGITFIPDFFQMYFGRRKEGIKDNEMWEDQDAHDYEWYHIDGDNYYKIQNIDVERDYFKWMIHKYNVKSEIKQAEACEDYERCAALKERDDKDQFVPTYNH